MPVRQFVYSVLMNFSDLFSQKIFVIAITLVNGLFLIGCSCADSSLFFAPIQLCQVSGALTLFAEPVGDQSRCNELGVFEVRACPGQQVFVRGRSEAESGAVAMASVEGITSYQLTHDRACFYHLGVGDSDVDEAAFQEQSVSSDHLFLLLKRNNKRHKKKSATPFAAQVYRNFWVNDYGSGNDASDREGFLKPGKPILSAVFTEKLRVNTFQSFLNRSNLFQQNIIPDDYHYLSLVILIPDAPSLHFGLSQQQFFYFLDDYASSGQWNSLFCWIKNHLESRSVLTNHLLDTFDSFSETDDLWQANTGMYQAIVSQLQDVMGYPEHTFRLELKLRWLNNCPGIIEVPGNSNGANSEQQASNGAGESDKSNQTGSSPLVSGSQHSRAGGNAGTGSSGDNGGIPPSPIDHTYNALPCTACGGFSCKLRQPAKIAVRGDAGMTRNDAATTVLAGHSASSSEVSQSQVTGAVAPDSGNPAVEEISEEQQVFHRWLRLINTYTRAGVVVRIMANIDRSIAFILENTPAPGTYLFPGSRTSTFSQEAPGVILSPDVPLIARFKKNALTARIVPLSCRILSTARAHRTASYFQAADYNTLEKSRSVRSYYKNHINNFSLFLKMMEKSFFFDCSLLNSASTVTSGHISENGAFSEGKGRAAGGRRPVIPHNEVIIKWDDWRANLLGFIIGIKKRTVFGMTFAPLRALISRLMSIVQNCELMTLPVALYDSGEARFIFAGSAGQIMAAGFNTIDDFLIPSNGLPQFEQLKGFELLNPDAFAVNIEYMGSLLAFHCLGGLSNIFCGNPKDSFLLQVLRVSCNRQLLEVGGFEFSREEALLLSYMATFPESFTVSEQGIDELIQLYQAHGGNAEVMQDMALAIAELGGLGSSKVAARFAVSDRTSRWPLYYYLLSTRLSHYKPLSEVDLGDASVDKLLLDTCQKNFMREINQINFAAINLDKGHAWPLMLAELRMVISAKAVEQLRKKGYQLQPWPYAEIMAMIPGQLNLLDQVEALIPDTQSPFVHWLCAHAIQNGLPLYPGTLRAGIHMTSNVRESLRRELAKRPTEQQINAITGNYPTVSSRSWENAEFPVWLQNPLAGMEQAADWQPPMVGLSGRAYFSPDSSQTNERPVTRISRKEDKDWKCSVCFDGDEHEPIRELICKHQLHQSCLEKLLQSSAKNQCPVCKKQLTTIRGNQPAGEMMWVVIDQHCPGEDTRETIIITYTTPSGCIAVSGQWVNYSADERVAYLPNHKKGRKALLMLKTAFEQGLVFTVGYSLSRGENNVVTWNDIPHKTRLAVLTVDHGYPDAEYVDRLIRILKEYNILEPDDADVL